MLTFPVHLVPHHNISLEYQVAFALQLLFNGIGIGFAKIINLSNDLTRSSFYFGLHEVTANQNVSMGILKSIYVYNHFVGTKFFQDKCH